MQSLCSFVQIAKLLMVVIVNYSKNGLKLVITRMALRGQGGVKIFKSSILGFCFRDVPMTLILGYKQLNNDFGLFGLPFRVFWWNWVEDFSWNCHKYLLFTNKSDPRGIGWKNVFWFFTFYTISSSFSQYFENRMWISHIEVLPIGSYK